MDAAIEERDELEVAFERARAKLDVALDDTEQTRTTAPWVTKSNVILQVFLPAIVMVCLPLGLALWAPETLPPEVWLTDPRFPLSVAVGVGLIAVILFDYRKRRRMPSAERTLRDFYSAAASVDDNVKGLAQFVVLADLDGAPRKQPPVNPTAKLPPLKNPKEVDQYWVNLGKLSPKHRHVISVEDVKFSEVSPEMVLASLKLRVVRVRRLPYLLCYLIVVVPVVLEDFLMSFGWWAFTGAFALAALAWLGLIRLLGRRGETHRVRKLLVRCGDKWRLFCADWEGYEERDLSWLDAQSRA